MCIVNLYFIWLVYSFVGFTHSVMLIDFPGLKIASIKIILQVLGTKDSS